jgi:hypothetical protein
MKLLVRDFQDFRQNLVDKKQEQKEAECLEEEWSSGFFLKWVSLKRNYMGRKKNKERT